MHKNDKDENYGLGSVANYKQVYLYCVSCVLVS